LISCTGNDDNYGPQGTDPSDPVTVETGVFVLNEGNFQWGNSSLTHYDPVNRTIQQGVFEQRNGIPLGDVAQSLTILGDTCYLVINNSNRIRALSLTNLQQHHELTGFTSPRYLLPITQNRALVSDLYADQIWVCDLTSGQITGSLPIAGWCEEMLISGSYIGVLNEEEQNVHVIHATTLELEGEVQLSSPAQRLIQGLNDDAWILAETALYRIRSGAFQAPELVSQWTQPIDASRATFNPVTESIFFLDQHVWTLNTSASPADTPRVFLEGGERNWYGIQTDPVSGDIYITDAKDYLSAGSVWRYSAQGQLIHTFDAGVIPQHIAFYER